uniref:DUF2066 domain-containing protein n=1 Tax=Candidatus Kentrum sp. SD TaxID=2126332 RepID=A0A451BQH9_9GAMM|nr:MAG: hypothetical protein BECKSD772F_GA0070984_101315 [Candidatus Kentron sp. SD]VFK42291.1 MAG: hypothetical protein BECKSD772E_GA0070983_101611 [Candidatus Kentron sp. SD]VFK80562.1 MAG: hypothetical protein BECKSD772D_GA0070982_11283 [Candidatus Kentron sp. SD]
MIGIPCQQARRLLAGLCFLVGAASMSTYAAVDSDERHALYETEVPVANESESERNAVMRTALLQVMTKLSGRRKLSKHPGMNRILQHAERHVQQFRYRSKPKIASDESTSPVDGLIFHVRFDSASVDKLLREANIRTWRKTRPSVLVWLLIKEDEEHVLLSARDNHELSNILHASATERGVSVILPLLDLDDQLRISEIDVRKGDRDRISEASERYAVDAVLVGRAFPSLASPTRWEARWELFGEEITNNWTNKGDKAKKVLRDGIHKAIDIFVARYAVSKEENTNLVYESVELTVIDIRNIGDYAKALRYLENLQSGAKVYVTEAGANRISFRLSIRGGRTTFEKMIKDGTTIARTTTVNPDGAPMYRLLP